MDDLTAFVTARLDEDQAAALSLAALPGGVSLVTGMDNHCGDYDPARALREVAAKRAIVTRYETACRQAQIARVNGGGPEQEAWEKIAGALELDVRDLASIDSHHPDYNQKWSTGRTA